MRPASFALLPLLVGSGCAVDNGAFSWDTTESWTPAARTEVLHVAPRRDTERVVTPEPAHRAPAPPALALAAVDEPRRESPVGEPRVLVPTAAIVDAPRSEGNDEPEASPRLVATAKVTPIYARPSTKSKKLGYLRTGAVVTRGPEPVGREGCAGGFYPVTPEGFVCVGSGASLDTQHELARAGIRRADRSAPMPYTYGMAEGGGVPFYSRLPTVAEQGATEPDFAARRARAVSDSFEGLAVDAVPWFLEGGASSIGTNGRRFSHESPVLRRGIAKSGFAFVSLFEASNRRFGLTVDMTVVPLDRFRRVEPSAFHGVPLVDVALPIVFVRTRGASLYAGDPNGQLRTERRLDYREAVPITGRRVRGQGTWYLETRGGGFIADQDSLVRIEPLATLPAWAVPGRTWIDVSIDRQTLVAYEGERAVFATLVSTGKDGTGDPETTHSTIQGQFLIHTKHVTATMDGDEVGDEFDLRDVPYVQYFKDGFALHAAYWHDGFGAPRSHGCVNLSPLDARWLFSFTEPHVPMAWHGAMSGHGTLVSVHP